MFARKDRGRSKTVCLAGRLRKTHPAAVKQNKSVEIVCQLRRPPHLMRNVLTNRIHSMLTFGFNQLDRRYVFKEKKLDAVFEKVDTVRFALSRLH